VARRRAAAPQAVLPSGRSISMQVDGQGEYLEVRSPGGEVEVRIDFTPEGPSVKLRCAQLELASTGDIAMNCRNFSVQTSEDVKMNGRYVLLNCSEPEEGV